MLPLTTFEDITVKHLLTRAYQLAELHSQPGKGEGGAGLVAAALNHRRVA